MVIIPGKPGIAEVPQVAKLDTRNKYEKGIDNMNELLPYAFKEWDVQAKMLRYKYDRLVKEGFTEAQALEIVKARPLYE